MKPAIPCAAQHVERLVHPSPRAVGDHRVARHRSGEAQRHRPPGPTKPPAGVISTHPTMIAVAAPIAVTVRPRISVEREPCDQRARRSQQRVGERQRRVRPRAEPAAAVEPEPTEPQQSGADQHIHGVVRQERLAPVVLARPYDQRRGKRREPGSHLDRDAAGEVECSRPRISY